MYFKVHSPTKTKQITYLFVRTRIFYYFVHTKTNSLNVQNKCQFSHRTTTTFTLTEMNFLEFFTTKKNFSSIFLV